MVLAAESEISEEELIALVVEGNTADKSFLRYVPAPAVYPIASEQFPLNKPGRLSFLLAF